ncbi:MAG: GWxTD domain-containing protein [FCB group bacterium]|nr:GWxTD domain-containing protein [FCB group bacterium]
MWFNTSFAADPDQIQVTVWIKIPNQNLVFFKADTSFHAKVEYSLAIVDPGTKKQVSQKTWTENIGLDYYEDTRDPKLNHIAYAAFTLPGGTYEFSVIIRDKDSKHSWKLHKTYEVEPLEYWSDIIPLVRHNGHFVNVGSVLSDADTVFCKFQLSPLQNAEDLQVRYSIIQDDSTLTTGAAAVENIGAQVYLFAIPLREQWSGALTIKVMSGEHQKEFDVAIHRDMLDRYIGDIEESTKWMSVILPYADYQQLKRMKPNEQRLYLIDYWKARDPSPGTEFNELMDQFYTRVEYANNNFGVLTEGWRSDQGRIYIQYGKPAKVENSGTDGYGRSYQIWYYQSNKRFIFLNDGFGDYRMIREVN